MSPAPWCPMRMWLLLIACGTAATARADEAVRLTPHNEPSAVFGDSETTLTYTIRREGSFDGTLAWVHSAGRRTIARGELPVTDADQFAIRLRIPPVRETVAFETTLTVVLQPRGGGRAVASHSRSLWIFPQDPFAGRSEWLASLDITLFDPEGPTRDVLNASKIPFREVRHVDALDQVDGGVVIVGEGCSWRAFRGLGDLLPQVAAKGVAVLCLAPAEGSFVLPGSGGSDSPRPDAVALGRTDLIAKRDKRLDAAAWNGAGELVASRLAIVSSRSGVTAEVSDDRAGWSWLEFDYANKGRWIVCGFGVIEHWDASPNARFFLANLLEDFSQSRGDKK